MPISRISLLKGKSPEYLRALSDSLHQALVEAFEVPPTDRFQLIHQHEPNELVFDREYLGGPRSDNFVTINITIGRQRTAATKQAFYQRLVQLLEQKPGIHPEDVLVVITPVQTEDWSFGGGRQGIGWPPSDSGQR
ncbi:tautomerase family protein [Massilia sp. MB5]|uniref:tautomerase family protein n=1 Tax=unclassified Massilia TaxID=2609279 RepID=UPI00067D0ECE|nr:MULTISPECIES: tautomerase family protein [unclassified Massilia]AKU23651.1 decarboxylase [Massilia sp. NR 4-1]UMR31418.1 tautomerase family protein [Massilia sp. MB5]